jgi:hypothetical protein
MRSTPHSRQEPQQQRNVGALSARSVAPALQLNPSKATWRCSMTSTGHLFSIRTSSLIKTLWSTVLLNPLPLASTLAWCRNVGGRQAPGSIYTTIFSCNILRILFASQLGSQPLPRCEQCGLQMPVEDLSQGHHRTALCQRGWERKGQYAAAIHSQQALG